MLSTEFPLNKCISQPLFTCIPGVLYFLWKIHFNKSIHAHLFDYMIYVESHKSYTKEKELMFHIYAYIHTWVSLVAQSVKNLPAMQVTWVWSLGWEDPLEEGMATHSSSLAWKIPTDRQPSGLHSMGSQRVGHDRATKPSTQHAYTQALSSGKPNNDW